MAVVAGGCFTQSPAEEDRRSVAPGQLQSLALQRASTVTFAGVLTSDTLLLSSDRLHCWSSVADAPFTPEIKLK